jgi:squalene-hopene/tetraprenyl-beta-curcumene cyclase
MAWLLAQLFRITHPYTGAAPGGWAWTDLPGGVPDADDTAGALVALWHLDPRGDPARDAAVHGVTWLLNLQNADGGIPTVCRGWGTLPFDRSAPDLTAHALQAWALWTERMPQVVLPKLQKAAGRAHQYLADSQRANGSWVPLWFGNEGVANDENPVYGTARVLAGLVSETHQPGGAAMRRRAIDFLLAAQSSNGGWGGDRDVAPSIEETALAVTALDGYVHATAARNRGLNWLVERFESGEPIEPRPVGLYFARLWYWERLYPWIFAADALGTVPPVAPDL